MNTTLWIALLLAGQVPPSGQIQPAKAAPEKAAQENSAGKAANSQEAEKQRPLTLDQIAAGAKNDAFIDEFIKDKKIKLYGRILQVERWSTGAKADQGYRVLMGRLSREDHAVDVEVWFLFPRDARKELAMLEPGTSRITIEGVCAETQMQSLTNGLGLTLAIKDCQIVETPEEIESAAAGSRTSILPVVTPNGTDPLQPMLNAVPMLPLPGTTPGPAPPPVPQQPMPLPTLPPRGM